MTLIGEAIIITEEEREEILTCIEGIFKSQNSDKLDLKHRLPYYIPTLEVVKQHMNLDQKLLLPYYYYLTYKDDNGNYAFEPDDTDLKEVRKYLEEYYENKIFVVEDKEQEMAYLKRYETASNNNIE